MYELEDDHANLVEHLTERGAAVHVDANIMGRLWVFAASVDRRITAAYYIRDDSGAVGGAGSGRFSRGHADPRPEGWGSDRLYHPGDLAELVETLGLPR